MLKNKLIILTFDDNAYNHYYNVFELLKTFNMTATFAYITSGKYADLNNEDKIKEMQEYGIEFASHTHSHVDLKKYDFDTIKNDIELSVQKLKSLNVNNPGLICPYNRISKDNLIKISNNFNINYILHKTSTVHNYTKFAKKKTFGKNNLIRIEFPTEDQDKANLIKFYDILTNLDPNEIPIIMFHNVCDFKNKNMNVRVNTFESFLTFIKFYNFKTITLDQLINLKQ